MQALSSHVVVLSYMQVSLGYADGIGITNTCIHGTHGGWGTSVMGWTLSRWNDEMALDGRSSPLLFLFSSCNV